MAKPLVILLLTNDWIGSVFYLRVFCLSFVIWPIHTENLNAIKAMGRSDLFLKLEIIKKIVGVISIIVTIPIGVKALALSLLVTGLISQFINAWPNKKLMNYGYLEQMKDIIPSVMLSVVMCLVVVQFTRLGFPDGVVLVIQIISGVVIYIIGSKLFHFEEYTYIKENAKYYFQNRKAHK